MNIGYACLTLGVRDADYKTCRMDHATPERLREIIAHNLATLETVMDYNIQADIRMFRISSDLIPFGSSPVNPLSWWELFSPEFERIGQKIKTNGIRVSMHPGQYTVLNSLDENVVARATEDLIYHARVLDAMSLDATHKIILHIGGIYGDKPAAIDRFLFNYEQLPSAVKRRLIIENDDRSYTICDVLGIAQRGGMPVVYDNLHNRLNPCDASVGDVAWIHAAQATWKPVDGRQKIHYSEQDSLKQTGSHSFSVDLDSFLALYQNLTNVDVMLEVKDKNLSCVKCVNATRSDRVIKHLELEWSKYKYTVLEMDPLAYEEIRALLKDKARYPVIEFYHLIQRALQSTPSTGHQVNAASHVYGYFKKQASEKEKATFQTRLSQFEHGTGSLSSVKKHLWNLVMKYQEPYLLASYYFDL